MHLHNIKHIRQIIIRSENIVQVIKIFKESMRNILNFIFQF